ncbi:hypothetical protein ACIBG8_48940 [Nonomuraea sp. NPDC050556]|uniref:hypothetical protein n=1 Tax=Nonomuraea sp. NPDC050556 TaxID=3364369 RepID=UPI0037A00AE8
MKLPGNDERAYRKSILARVICAEKGKQTYLGMINGIHVLDFQIQIMSTGDEKQIFMRGNRKKGIPPREGDLVEIPVSPDSREDSHQLEELYNHTPGRKGKLKVWTNPFEIKF